MELKHGLWSQTMKIHFFTRQSLYLIVFLGALLTVIWMGLCQKGLYLTAFDPKKQLIQVWKNPTDDRKTLHENVTKRTPSCKGCSKHINKVLKDFSFNWTKNEENHQKLRALLYLNCNGFQKAFLTQTNSPVGTTIVYQMEKRNRNITRDLFNTFPKGEPFSGKTLSTCAVVGSGGILANSSCGEAIDSSQFVMRCNLSPLENGYSKHVGKKTGLVTANPTILRKKYGSLHGRRRAFLDDVGIYGDSLMLLSAFTYGFCTGLSITAHYTLEDFRSPVKAVFINPDYLRSVNEFWRSQGVKGRMSSGFLMVSLALEICDNVEVYGFWPFDNHPYRDQPLTYHYYDNAWRKRSPHVLPAEFEYLLKLHNQGVLKLHLGDCPSMANTVEFHTMKFYILLCFVCTSMLSLYL